MISWVLIMINFDAIGKRIKEKRKELLLTQEKLAEMLDVSVEHLSRIETGSYRPSLALIEKICRIFGVDESELMFGDKKDYQFNKGLYFKIESLTAEKREAIEKIIDYMN